MNVLFLKNCQNVIRTMGRLLHDTQLNGRYSSRRSTWIVIYIDDYPYCGAIEGQYRWIGFGAGQPADNTPPNVRYTSSANS